MHNDARGINDNPCFLIFINLKVCETLELKGGYTYL